MKLTESQLRKIIREELEAVREADAPKLFFAALYRKGFEDEGGKILRGKFETAEQAKVYIEDNFAGEYDSLKIYDDVPVRGVEPVLTSDAPLREVDDLSKATAKAMDKHIELRNSLIGAGYSKRFLQDRLSRPRYGENPPPAHKLENLGLRMSQGMSLDDAKAEFMKMHPRRAKTMDEEKLEPGLDVIANLFKDYRVKYGVNFDRFLFYVRQMLKKEGIDAKHAKASYVKRHGWEKRDENIMLFAKPPVCR